MSKTPVRVAVTGAAGQIGYSLLFRIAAGDMLGKDQPVILQLLDLPQAQKACQGVIMELDDCAFPLLAGVFATDQPDVAFKDADICLLVGARPRGPGMERADLLSANGAIFTVQGKSIAENAKEDVKVLVVGNPANTNAYIARAAAKKVGRTKPENYHAMLRLDYNRAKEALRALTRTAAREWAPYGICCNVICPAALSASSRRMMAQQPGMIERIEAANPMGRMGDPEQDIAGAAFFLASEDARYVTGNTLFVDGGHHILN